jgi:hypothetical protein
MPADKITREANVRAAFERAVHALLTQDQLLDAVRDLVRYLKDNGEPPERVLIVVKRLCGMPLVPFAGHRDPAADPEAVRFIAEAVVAVAIEEYFSRQTVDRVESM